MLPQGRLYSVYGKSAHSQKLRMVRGTCHLQVSLEMDDESEDEVEALSEMYDPDCSSDGTYRFVLLKELWASAR